MSSASRSTALDASTIAATIAARRAEILCLGVRTLRLFGSVSRGESSESSDIDVLVEFEPGAKSYRRFLDLSELLEAAPGRRVDVVTMESLSPHVGPHILAEARDVLRVA